MRRGFRRRKKRESRLAFSASIESITKLTSAGRLASESPEFPKQAGKPSVNWFPGCGGAATTKPKLASAMVRNVDWVGMPHEPVDVPDHGAGEIGRAHV